MTKLSEMGGSVKKKKTKGSYTWLYLLYFLAAGAAVLAICSRSSFLYPFNNWDDANSYFTVGKSMMQGQVPYRDVFDQKGMYLYFFYGLCSLISPRTFAGVYGMEILLAAVDLWCMWRILRLYLPEKLSLILTSPILALLFSSRSFYWGGSAEEICLPFLFIALWLSIRYFKERYPQPMSYRDIVIAGLCCGVVANIKFTLLGFYFAWMMMVAFATLMGKHAKRFIPSCLVFLGAMAVPFLPWAVYFGMHHALADWYDGYVYTNVFLYSTFGAGNKGESVLVHSKGLVLILYWLIRTDLQYFILIIPGLLWALLHRKQSIMERLNPVVLFGFTFLGIYIGGVELPYYSMPLTIFAVFGGVVIGKLFCGLCRKSAETKKKEIKSAGKQSKDVAETEEKGKAEEKKSIRIKTTGLFVAAVVLAVVAAVGISYGLTMNRYYLSYTKDDLFQYQFAGTIEESGIENPTMLNYNCLDAGLYTVAGVYPDCRWFQTQTLPTDMVYEAQYGYMREGRTDFVLVRDEYPSFLTDTYELVDERKQVMGETEHTYYLFQRKVTD